jgi:phosphatidylinositol alpha 1,6-mannosyltransferase
VMPANPPRIALFTDSFHEVNGVALTCREFEAFANRRDTPFFSCHAGPDTRSWDDGSVTRYEWKRSRVALGLEADLSFDLLFQRHARGIRAALRRFRPDFVQITSPGDCGLLGVLLAHEMHIPIAASWHTNVHEFGARRFERLISFLTRSVRSAAAKYVEDRILDLTLLFYKIAKVLFAPNPELMSLLECRLGKSCGLMSRGIDTSLFDPARRQREDSKFRIGYVGRLSAEKNLQAFISLERALLANGHQDFEVVFVGHGSMTSTLAASIPHARFTGVLKGESLAREYAGFDAFVFPSRTDTFGNVVLEALASGVPVVVTDAGGPRFLVREGDTGFIVENTDELIRRTSLLMRDAELRQRIRMRARQYALSHHGWDSVFERVYLHYQAYTSGLLNNVNPHTKLKFMPNV